MEAVVPPLRQQCMWVLAAALVGADGSVWQPLDSWHVDQSCLRAGIAALPQELRLDLLLVLAGWQLLDDAAVALLTAGDGGGEGDTGGEAGSASHAGISDPNISSHSILAGQAALSLAGCALLSGHSVQRLLGGALPQLRAVNLKGVVQLNDTDVALLLSSCPNVKRLDLSNCMQLTSAAVQAVSGSTASRGLQALSLAGCWQVDSLPGLSGCTGLTSLNLSGCWQLTAGAVREVLASTSLLEELNLACCPRLGDGTLITTTYGQMSGLPRQFQGWGRNARNAAVGGAARGRAAAAGGGALGAAAGQAAAGAGAGAGAGVAENLWGEADDEQDRIWMDAGDWEGQAAADVEGGVQEREQEVEQEVEGEEEEDVVKMMLPLGGVQLPQLRSLDMSGTAADDCLLYWLAQYSCARLQKLSISNSHITGLGVFALLAAKRALLHHQRCSADLKGRCGASCDGAPGTAASTAGTAAGGCEVLPLLELSVAGTAALSAAVQQHAAQAEELREMQESYESVRRGGLQVHFAPAASSSEDSRVDPAPQPLVVSLLEPPPDAVCELCQGGATGADVAAGVADVAVAAPPASWPPVSPSEVLSALSPAGLARLQALDLAGSGGTSALADVIASRCSSLQRLRLAGCKGLDDASLAAILEHLPVLRDLDISGCTGSRVSRPGSRFLRHKVPRLQEGGVTDDSLRLLTSRDPQSHPQQQQQQQQMSIAPPRRHTQQGQQQIQHQPGNLVAADPPPAASQEASAAPCTAATPPTAGAAPGLVALASLNLGGLAITDASLATVAASSAGQLSSLSLRGCPRITDGGLLQLLASCRSLARLDIAGCSQITAAGFGCYTPFASQASTAQQQLPTAAGAGTCHNIGPQGDLARTEQVQHDWLAQQDQLAQQAQQDWLVQQQAQQAQQAQRAQLVLFQQVVSTATGVRLQRAALPKQACTREVLAWLAGQAGSSSSGGSGGGGGGGGGSGSQVSGAVSSRGPAGGSHLQRLELATCAALCEADLLALAACCPQLRTLQLTAAGAAVSSRLCAALAQHCRLLTRLVVGGASLADADLALLLHGLPALQHLELSGCCAIVGSVFKQQMQQQQQQGQQSMQQQGQQQQQQQHHQQQQRHQQQQQADCSPTGPTQGPAPPATSSSCGGAGSRRLLLRTLRLDCSSIDDVAAAALIVSCPHLETLSLRHCHRVTSAAAGTTLDACRNLRQLLLGGTGVGEPCVLPTVTQGSRSGYPPPNMAPTSRFPPTTPSANPRALVVVELPTRAGRWAQQWRQLLSTLGEPQLVLRD